MSKLVTIAASSGPRIKDSDAVRRVIEHNYMPPVLRLAVESQPGTDALRLFLHGSVWPEAWRIPEGIAPEAFNPYDDALYERGAEGFLRLLQELAPHLEESLTVHVVAYLGRRFPLAACEWHVEPGGAAIEVNEFRHGADDLTVQVIRPDQPPPLSGQ